MIKWRNHIGIGIELGREGGGKGSEWEVIVGKSGVDWEMEGNGRKWKGA